MGEAKKQTKWSRRSAIFGAIGGLIAMTSIIVTIVLSRRPGASELRPVGMIALVRTDDIGGVAIVAVAGGTSPVDYLRDGTRLYIDCLQLVEPNYVQAHISDGPFVTRWIDALRLRTERNEEVRNLDPPVRFCGPPVRLDLGSQAP
jgi:hypothetical protein